MGILTHLASQTTDTAANYQVAAQCLQDEALVQEIAAGLGHADNKIVIDCAEVLTEVAKEKPTWVSPYGHLLPAVLDNKNNRARWEAMHCLALIAEYVPDVIRPLIGRLDQIILEDKSVIVRDYAIDAVGNYAQTSPEAALAAYPILERATSVWERRHAKQALNGLAHVVTMVPEKQAPVQQIAEQNLNHAKGTARQAAKKLLRLTEKM